MLFIFFLNDPATTVSYTLSLHDALPILFYPCHFRKVLQLIGAQVLAIAGMMCAAGEYHTCYSQNRSEEHTSELQSRQYLVCRLLLEKKKHELIASRPSEGSSNKRIL